MTLPTSGTITMGMVKTELGLSSSTVLTLTDSRVRTLFGKPTGVIKLTYGYGKSSVHAYRPSTLSTSNRTPTNPERAYDTTAASVDTTTFSSLTTGSDETILIYSGFGSSTVSGILHIGVYSIQTEMNEDRGYDQNDTPYDARAESYVNISLSINNGSSWISFDQTCQWTSGTDCTNVILTKTLTNQNLALLKVKMIVVGQYNSDGPAQVNSEATCQISDIVVY